MYRDRGHCEWPLSLYRITFSTHNTWAYGKAVFAYWSSIVYFLPYFRYSSIRHTLKISESTRGMASIHTFL